MVLKIIIRQFSCFFENYVQKYFFWTSTWQCVYTQSQCMCGCTQFWPLVNYILTPGSTLFWPWLTQLAKILSAISTSSNVVPSLQVLRTSGKAILTVYIFSFITCTLLLVTFLATYLAGVFSVTESLFASSFLLSSWSWLLSRTM